MPKIGILLPRSNFYSGMSFDFVEGFKAGLKQIKRDDIEIVVENIGFGAEKQAAYQAAESLLIKENVQIVLAYIGHKTAQLLKPLFMSANRLLIVLDSGSNMPQEWPVCPNIIYHSLNDCLACYFSAKQAFLDGHEQAGMVTGYYDGGYLHTLALTQSYVDAGGSIVFNHATGYVPEDFSMSALNTHLSNYPGAAFLCIFSVDYSQWFFRDLKEQVTEKQTAVYASSFMLEESSLGQIPFPESKVKGFVSWSKELDNPENKMFVDEMFEAGREANYFSLLAYESVCLVQECIKLLEENQKRVPVAVQKLNGFQFKSPRGQVKFYPAFNYTLSPMYHVEIVADEAGMSKLKVLDLRSDCEADFEKMAEIDLDGVTSGWFNSYVCI